MRQVKFDDDTIYALVTEQLAAGERVEFRVGGRSMLPSLSATDTILLEPLQDEPREGDVLFFRHGGRHVIHRLVGREADTYVMQGDNNYGTERVGRDALLARLVSVTRADGTVVATDSDAWLRISRRALRRKKVRNFFLRWLGHKGRRKLRPWYFVALAFLMWAPLNGVGIPLDNYLLGLRMDHLLHASVFIPCALFWRDLFRRSRNLYGWLAAVATGLLTEGVQYLLPYRGFDVNDLIANFLGVSLGALLLWVYRKFSSR